MLGTGTAIWWVTEPHLEHHCGCGDFNYTPRGVIYTPRGIIDDV
jgi:hypothetical protein